MGRGELMEGAVEWLYFEDELRGDWLVLSTRLSCSLRGVKTHGINSSTVVIWKVPSGLVMYTVMSRLN